MTDTELVERAGSSLERVRQLIQLGIVRAGADGDYRPSDIQRVRLADAFEASGIPIEDLGAVMASGHVTLAGLDIIFAKPVASLPKTFRELCAETGRSPDEVRRFYGQLGLPRPMDDDRVREDDAEIVPTLLAAWDLRAFDVAQEFSDRMARICGENMYRLVRAFAQLWETAVDEPVERSGDQELYRLALLKSVESLDATERATLWLFRRFTEHEIVEDIVDNVEDAMEEAGLGRRRAAVPPAIAFLDLSGFTRLTESRGDDDAAKLAATLAELVHDASRMNGGRAVKFLGDGVMLHFSNPGGAVLAGLELVERIPEAGLPQARVGINAGRIVFRDGDYYGRAVNIAARMADYARPREALVSDEARRAATLDAVAFAEIGPVELKGVREPVTLYQARRA